MLSLDDKIKSYYVNSFNNQLKYFDNVFNINFNNNIEKIKYNICSTVTGRTTIKDGYFNILTLPKVDRKKITSFHNDGKIICFDFKSFDINILINIYESNNEELVNCNDPYLLIMSKCNLTSRNEAKKILISTLYGLKNEKYKIIKNIFKNLINYKNNIMNNKNDIYTILDRKIIYKDLILSNREHAFLSRVAQTNGSDLMFYCLKKISKLLNNKKSKICFFIFDAIYVDIHNEELSLIKDIKHIMENDCSNFFNFKRKMNVGVSCE